MVQIQLTAVIQNFGDAGYIGWTERIKGLVVQGDSIQETLNELIKSIKVKIAYDFGLDISQITQETEQSTNHYDEVLLTDQSDCKSYQLTI